MLSSPESSGDMPGRVTAVMLASLRRSRNHRSDGVAMTMSPTHVGIRIIR